jgi:hypothetical protein
MDLADQELQMALAESIQGSAVKATEDHSVAEFEEIRSVLCSPEKLAAILAQLPGVDPSDPRFLEFIHSIQ